MHTILDGELELTSGSHYSWVGMRFVAEKNKARTMRKGGRLLEYDVYDIA